MRGPATTRARCRVLAGTIAGAALTALCVAASASALAMGARLSAEEDARRYRDGYPGQAAEEDANSSANGQYTWA